MMGDPLTDPSAAWMFMAERAWGDPHSRSVWPREPVRLGRNGQPRCWAASTVHGLYQCRNTGKVKLADGSTWCGLHAPKPLSSSR